MGLQGGTEGIILNGGRRTVQGIARLLDGVWGEAGAPIGHRLAAVEDGDVIPEEGFTIRPFPVRHRDTDSFGYEFEGVPRRHLRPERLAALRVPDGPIRKELAEGRPAILADGRTIDPADVLEASDRRKKLVVIGDAETTAGLRDRALRADALVIEATFLVRDRETARNYGHLTAAEAAQFAQDAAVGKLILTHISGRYPVEEILAEARAIYPGAHVATDLERISV